jgi:hypothetical protein
MATYKLIINRIIDLNTNIFSYNYDKKDNIDCIIKNFFADMYSDCNLRKNKFIKFNTFVNCFYLIESFNKKNEFLNLFCKIQKIYHTLNNFIYRYKYNKSKIRINTDLQLNEISLNEKNVICIYHINSKYLFKIDELLKIIYMSLTNSFSFFCEPIAIKNPYNNIPFGKSVLYYIYFYIINNLNIKYLKFNYIDIFFKFKECNFNMTKFVDKYEHLLREFIIENFINNSTKEKLTNIIRRMIYDFNLKFKSDKRKILISEEFPNEILIEIFKPYLHLKIISIYSLTYTSKIEARNKLNKKLLEFQKYNPQFGKKIINYKIINKNGFKRVKTHTEFNMNHKKFDTYEIDCFMNNHLSYRYNGHYEESDEVNDDEEGEEINNDTDDEIGENNVYFIDVIFTNNIESNVVLNDTETINTEQPENEDIM